MRGDPPKMELVYKKLCILTCLNFSYLPVTLHLMQYSYRDVFSTTQNSFWSHWFWCLLVLLLFCFTSSRLAKHFPLRTFFIRGKKKVAQGEMGWIGRMEHGDHASFGQKLLNTQHGVDRRAPKTPIVKSANMLKESSKKTYWSPTNAASHNNAS